VFSQTSPEAAKAQLVARFVPESVREAIPLIDSAQELHDLLLRSTQMLFSIQTLQDYLFFLSVLNAVIPKIESKVKFGSYTLTGLPDRVLLPEDAEGKFTPGSIGFRL
jgi:hypothetical protein